MVRWGELPVRKQRYHKAAYTVDDYDDNAIDDDERFNVQLVYGF